MGAHLPAWLAWLFPLGWVAIWWTQRQWLKSQQPPRPKPIKAGKPFLTRDPDLPGYRRDP